MTTFDHRRRKSTNICAGSKDGHGHAYDPDPEYEDTPYTTGDRSLRGGWFKDLTVQVRQGKDWVAVEGLSISPDYDHSPNVLGQKTFTLTFDDTVSDGVRIFGAPGGDDYYTSVAELGVYDE